MLLTILQYMKQLPHKKNIIQSKMSIIPKLRPLTYVNRRGGKVYGNEILINSMFQCSSKQGHQLKRQRLGSQRVELNFYL